MLNNLYLYMLNNFKSCSIMCYVCYILYNYYLLYCQQQLFCFTFVHAQKSILIAHFGTSHVTLSISFQVLHLCPILSTLLLQSEFSSIFLNWLSHYVIHRSKCLKSCLMMVTFLMPILIFPAKVCGNPGT
jgi:hypothetical protein